MYGYGNYGIDYNISSTASSAATWMLVSLVAALIGGIVVYLVFLNKSNEGKFKGFVNWFTVQVQEEHAHAMGMFDYVHQRGGHVELEAIDKPVTNWSSPLHCFEEVLKHEEFVTSRINALMDVADEVKDRAALSFLDWYLKEQVEEEATVGDVLATLKLIKDDSKALLMLDKDLAARTFTAPVIG